jgi:hypothetical protein
VLSVLCTNLHWIGQIVSISNLKLAPTNHGDTTWPTGATCGSCWRVIVKTSFPNLLSCNAQADNRVGHPSLVSYRFRYHKVTIITQSRPFSRLSMQATGVSSLDKNARRYWLDDQQSIGRLESHNRLPSFGNGLMPLTSILGKIVSLHTGQPTRTEKA